MCRPLRPPETFGLFPLAGGSGCVGSTGPTEPTACEEERGGAEEEEEEEGKEEGNDDDTDFFVLGEIGLALTTGCSCGDLFRAGS